MKLDDEDEDGDDEQNSRWRRSSFKSKKSNKKIANPQRKMRGSFKSYVSQTKEADEEEDEDSSDEYVFMASAQGGSSTSEEEEEVDEEEPDLEAKLEAASKEIIRRGRTIRRLEAHIKQVEAKSEEAESQNGEIRAEHIDLKRRFEEQIKICEDLTVELGSRASKIEEMEKELLRLQ